MLPPWVRSSRFGGLDRDAVAERFDLAGEAVRVRVGATLLEPVGAEVDIGDSSVEDVEGGDEHRVLDRLAGFRVADPAAQSLELRAKVGVLRVAGGFCSLGEVGGEPLRVVSCLARP